MAYDTKTLIQHNALDKWNLFHDHLLYFLIYRVVTPQALELALLGLNAVPIYNNSKGQT